MIVAIVNQTAPAGLVKVEEFRRADDAASAVAAFCGEYNPALLTASYLGVDTGWGAYQYPTIDGGFWAYDFGSPGSIVEVAPRALMTLDQLKEERLKEIDARTDQLIDGGFIYNSVLLSMSIESQVRLEGADRNRNDPAMSYPIRWNSLDDSDAVDLTDATELHTMFLTALGTLRARIDSGTLLKDAVRAATTVAEVDAVVDGR
jgi:hypothetical protein